MQRVFTHIRQVNLWQSAESASGRGSELSVTAALRANLTGLIEKLSIQSILDAPCGDFNWMQHVSLSGVSYTGMDVVPEMVERNQSLHGTETIRFMAGDVTRDALPKVDLILCRDCLVHLPLRDGCLALRNFKQSGSQYLLTTTYLSVTKNQDAPVGSWKPLNLYLPPFNLPPPLIMFSDPSDDTGANPDKSLGLWDLQALPMPIVPRWHSPQVILANFVRRYLDPSWQL
ncbi:MAG: class I SAM-dependent methyltransferase [Elainellaceae cyanobacterium]